MALLWGDISICPPLHQFQLPCHSQAELSSLNGLKAWGGQKLCHDIAFLLVLAEEEATGARNYGLLTIWVNPSQARVHSMEEAVGKLTACTFCGPNWPYALVQLHEGTPQGEACGHPTPKSGGGNSLQPNQPTGSPPTPHCQPQVIYPVGLNGCNEPVITSLPEPLASSINLTAGELVYLEIDILTPPVEDPD